MLDTDLEAILIDYCDRIGTAMIEIDAFFKELKTQAMYKAQKDKAWGIWTKQPREHFDAELKLLVDSKTCTIQKNGSNEYIFYPSYFIERIRKAWDDAEDSEKATFPDGKKAHIMPDEEVLRVFEAKDLVQLLKEENKPELPIIQVDFPHNLGSMLLLAPFADTRLFDAATAKARHALINSEIRQYCLNRMHSVFPDKIAEATSIIETIVKTPIDCLRVMRESGGDDFLLWTKLCEFIIESASSDAVPVSEADCAIQQGAVIMAVYAAYYGELASQLTEKENILNELYEKLADPPYFWTLTEIYKLTGKDGKLIVHSLVRHDEIADFLIKKTRDKSDGTLPPLLIFYNEFKEKCFIKKERVFQAFSALINITKQKVEESINRKWYNIVKDYRVITAMKNNAAFETLLIKTVSQLRPFIVLLHKDGKLKLLRKEFVQTDTSNPEMNRFFYGNEIKSLTALYELDRKHIVQKIKTSLPFWYSVPLFVAIIKIFRVSNPYNKSEDDD